MVKEWYLRVRGKVTGPFRLDEIEAFRARGQLLPFHEVSRDERTWQSVGSWRPNGNGEASLIDGDLPSPLIPSRPPPSDAEEPVPGRDLSPRAARMVAIVACIVSAVVGAGVVWVVDASSISATDRKIKDQESIREGLERRLATLGERDDSLGRQLKRLTEEKRSLAVRLDDHSKDRDELDKRLLVETRRAAGQVKAAEDARREAEAERQRVMAENQRLTDDVLRLKGELEVIQNPRLEKSPAKETAAKRERRTAIALMLDEIREAIGHMGKAKAKGDLDGVGLFRTKVKRLCDRVDEETDDPTVKRRVEFFRKAVRDIDRDN